MNRSPTSVADLSEILGTPSNGDKNITNSERQEKIFMLITSNIDVPKNLLRQFWTHLLDGRGHPFLQVSRSVLGDPSKAENSNVVAFRGFRQLVQHMSDHDVVTWTHTIFEKEIEVEVEKKEGDKGNNGGDREWQGGRQDHDTEKRKKQIEKVKVFSHYDGILRLTDAAFPQGRPR